jgi:hypothetical protein
MIEITILEKIYMLDDQQKQQVLLYVESLLPKPFDYEAWWRKADEIKASIREEYGDDYVVGSQQLLNELREEI